MDRKGSRSKRTRAFRRGKSSFHRDTPTKKNSSKYASTSAEKIRSADDEDFDIDEKLSYSFINFFFVFSTLASFVVCKDCHGEVTFERKNEKGIGFQVCMKCKKCSSEVLVNSSPLITQSYEINRRFVLIMRLLGVGLGGLNLFCGLMEISRGISRNLYYGCLGKIYEASSSIYNLSIERAVAQEKELNKSINLTVSGDGTWKKRRFSALVHCLGLQV